MTKEEFENLVELSFEAAAIAGYNMPESKYIIEYWPSGEHRDCVIGNRGMAAVYLFANGEEVYKVGHAGCGSNARFQSHHYNGSAPSTLKGSIEDDHELMQEVGDTDVRDWIFDNVDRFNLMLPEGYGNFVRTFIESFLILKTSPRFEQYGD